MLNTQICTMGSTPILPAWIVLPLAGLTLILIAAHVVGLQHAADRLGGVRIRIRSGIGVLLMFTTALLAYALSCTDVLTSPACEPQLAKTFVLTWVSISGLLGIVILLAAMDLMISLRRAIARRARIETELGPHVAEMFPIEPMQGFSGQR